MYNFLKAYVDERPRPDAEEVVAFALLCVDRAAGEEARAPLQALAPIHLAEIVLQFYDFLLDEVAGSEPTFSDFALLLRDTVPETFVEILVSLIKANIFTLCQCYNTNFFCYPLQILLSSIIFARKASSIPVERDTMRVSIQLARKIAKDKFYLI